jgi:hypothetical protein
MGPFHILKKNENGLPRLSQNINPQTSYFAPALLSLFISTKNKMEWPHCG